MKHNLVEKLRELAALGKTATEAAYLAGCSYPSAISAAKMGGFKFQTPNYIQHDAERESAILARFENGETLQAIGESYGVTRERIRQIVKKAGAKARSSQVKDRDAQILEFAKTAKTRDELFSAFPEVNSFTFLNILRRCNIAAPMTTAKKQRVDLINTIISEWKNSGRSIRSLCGRDAGLANAVTHHMKKIGIQRKKRKHATVAELAARVELFRQIVKDGGDYTDIASKAGVNKLNAANTVANHCADLRPFIAANRKAKSEARKAEKRLLRAAAAKKRREANSPRVYKTRPRRDQSSASNVIVMATVRETAIANRERASAAEIASAVGSTRNAIIGHWFRARQSGVIA